MAERDSHRQIRPKDGITLQYRARGGGEVVWENRIVNLPQWHSRFANSPVVPNINMLDTSKVVPGDKNSHVTLDAPHLGEAVEVKLDEEGKGVKELPEDVTVLVDATALTKKYRSHGSGKILGSGSGSGRKVNELKSFRS